MKFLLLIAVACAVLLLMLIGPPQNAGVGGVLPRDPAPGTVKIITIEDQVAVDAVARYRLVETGSNSAARCEEARAAAEALSRTRFDASYERWKETEQRECAAAARRGRR